MSLTAFVLHLRANESLTIHVERDIVQYELSVGIGTHRQQRIVGAVDIERIKTTHYDVLADELHRQLDAARIVHKAWNKK